MSNPSNRLASYRSYSYYHVLLLCDSTATAVSVASDTELNTWQHPSSNTPLGIYAPKNAKSGGRYCVMVNGSTDANVAITKATWSSITSGTVTPNDRGGSLAIEGSLSFSEPKGIAFLDNVVNSCIELGVDAAHAVWLLKTFFVGYKDDDDHDHITDINPLMFVVIDVTGSFTEQGGLYDMSFVAISHGLTRLPQFSKAGKATNIPVGNTISKTFDELQRQIQLNYESYYSCVESQVKAADPTGQISSTLRRVNYIIKADPPYDTDLYAVDDFPVQIKHTMDCSNSEGTPFRIDANGSIESGILDIMHKSKQVKKDADTGDGYYRYAPKIFTTFDFSKQDAKGQTVFNIYYIVRRVLIPQSISFQDYAVTPGTPLAEKLQKNIITFDYLYTGHNTDIVEFDLKMTMGLVYLQAATASATYRTTFSEAQTLTTASNDSIKAAANRLGKPTNEIPVYFGTQIKLDNNSRNSNDASITVQAAYTMTKHASIEMVDTTMKIIGNPDMLSSVNMNSGPIGIVPGTSKPESNGTLGDWGDIPSIAKVNIKMPRHNNDLSLFMGGSTNDPNKQDNSTDYAVDFWFQGYYYILSIDHIFENGEFYQTLEMIGIPEKLNEPPSKASNPNTQSIDINQKISNCYDNIIDCQKSQNKIPVAVPEQRSSIGAPLLDPMDTIIPGSIDKNTSDYIQNHPSVNDMKSLNEQVLADKDLHNVVGWDKADKQVQDSIKNAADEHGVDPVLLAQFASHETGHTFDVNSNSHTKSKVPPGLTREQWLSKGAKGLFQFIPGTAAEYGISGNESNASANANAGAKMLANNIKTFQRKFGTNRIPTAGELYMMHNQGAAGALTIIQACETGNESLIDNAPLDHGLTLRARMSAQVQGRKMNACEFRNWAESVMAKTTKQGMLHVPHFINKSTVTGIAGGPIGGRTAREARAVIKDCGVESIVNQDTNKKDNCTNQPTINQDQKK